VKPHTSICCNMCVVVGFVGCNSNIFVERGKAEGGKWKGAIRRHTVGRLFVLLALKNQCGPI
jgi:hypothetical protein